MLSRVGTKTCPPYPAFEGVRAAEEMNQKIKRGQFVK